MLILAVLIMALFFRGFLVPSSSLTPAELSRMYGRFHFHPSPVGRRWREAPDEGLAAVADAKILNSESAARPSSALRAPSPDGGRVTIFLYPITLLALAAAGLTVPTQPAFHKTSAALDDHKSLMPPSIHPRLSEPQKPLTALERFAASRRRSSLTCGWLGLFQLATNSFRYQEWAALTVPARRVTFPQSAAGWR